MADEANENQTNIDKESIRRVARGEAELNRRIRDLDASLQSAAVHQQPLRNWNSRLWSIIASHSLLQQTLTSITTGAIAWVRFEPGSRPRRAVRTAIIRLINTINQQPAFAAIAKRSIERFPHASARLRSIMQHGRALKFAPANSLRPDDMPALVLEPCSVRLIFRRLMQARINVERMLSNNAGDDAGEIRRDKANDAALPRLAYVSPLPPERTGIGDYSAQLIPELARYYAIDVIIAQDRVSDPWINQHCIIRGPSWFEQNAQIYDRIVYHIGNSLYHAHMLPLLEKYPGVVVLHDFYLGHLLAYLELHGGWQDIWTRELFHAHGFNALRDRYTPNVQEQTIAKFPVNLSLLQYAQGVIVHSQHSKSLAREFYGKDLANDWKVVPLPRPHAGAREDTRAGLGFKDDDFLVCSFGLMGETKLNIELLEAWLETPLALSDHCHLVFVGHADQDEYCTRLRNIIDASTVKERIHITGFVAPELYRRYLHAADIAVQLRTVSRGETSAAVLDCMAYALPTIVNANGSMAELSNDSVIMLPDRFEVDDLAAAITSLRNDPDRRRIVGSVAEAVVREHHSPRHVAGQYNAVIEDWAQHAPASRNVRRLADQAVKLIPAPPEDPVWLLTARAIAREDRLRAGARQLLVDVSILAQEDGKTGIQRVARAQLLTLLNDAPQGFRVEPVRLCNTDGCWHYRYARQYMLELLNLPQHMLEDNVIEMAQGDILYIPEYWVDGVVKAADAGLYKKIRDQGIQTSFVIYDMLPITRPEFFPDGAERAHRRWLVCVASNADKLICISNAVADEVRGWLAASKPEVLPHLEITSLHLGADIDASGPSKGVPKDAANTLALLSKRPTWLMVGTIEPRKGHLQTLAAFEHLWREGIDANLVIVGAEGWKSVPDDQRRTISTIVSKLRGHRELGNRLFWLDEASDEYLEMIYEACTCLIAASEGEGFGLPLIEAARHHRPILARDIPVFREVAGDFASYFSGSDPVALAQTIESWLAGYNSGNHPKSDGINWLTWADNVNALKSILLSASLADRKRPV